VQAAVVVEHMAVEQPEQAALAAVEQARLAQLQQHPVLQTQAAVEEAAVGPRHQIPEVLAALAAQASSNYKSLTTMMLHFLLPALLLLLAQRSLALIPIP
jgi:hypothetical protein